MTASRSPILRTAAAALCGAAALALFVAARAGQDQPGAAPAGPLELLQRAPFDRLTLVDGTTFEIEPISPRPLPPYDPAKDKKKAAPPAQPPPAPGQPAPEPPPEENPDELIIHLLEGIQRDFKVKRSSIRSVEYYEDMLMAEAEKFVNERRYPKAFEYLLAVQARNPGWRGLQDRVDRLLFEEGSWALAGNERERGLRLLRELFDRRPDYPGALGKLVAAYSGQIAEALDKGNYAHGRRVLHELAEVAPQDVAVADLTSRFVQRARDLLRRADEAQGAARLDLLTQALRVWPKLDEAVAPFEKSFREHPTLEVGVIDLPRPAAPWVRAPASARVVPLLYVPLLIDDSEEAQAGERPGQLAADLEIGDLGRRLDVTLRPGLVWSDGSREVGAIDVVRSLADRAQPRSPSYNARWASLLDRIETIDADRVAIRLRRTPVDPFAWLITPIGPAHAAWDGRVSTTDGRRPVGDGPFVFDAETRTTALYRAAERPDASQAAEAIVPRPRIARLREVRVSDTAAIMGAFARGEVALIEHVPADRVPGLLRDESVVVGRYRLPTLHRIAIDGRNPLLKDRNLRRALAYAIDRKALLEETVLKRPIDAVNAPSDGVFAFDSTANAPDVPPLETNMLTARMLVGAVSQQLSMPRIQLTFQYPATPEARLAAPKIAEMLRAAGLVITLTERPETELEQALRSGERFDLAYRASRCDEPVREVGTMLCPGYDAPPEADGLGAIASDRMRQLLLQLEQAPNGNIARALAVQIDRECRDELPIIPLWQLQDHFAHRPNLKGPADVADHLYQGIERWEIEPWFAKDPW
jgi:peptide/nickel transport system substrate-binding protein